MHVRPPFASLRAARWLVLGLAAAFAPAPARAQTAPATATVTVSITGLKARPGVVLVRLYDAEKSWLKTPGALRQKTLELAGDALSVPFEALAPGTYAVSVVHDEDGNGKMDMRWFPWPRPKEGAGASNNPAPGLGPPGWDASKFTVGGDVTITVALQYFD